MIQLLSKESPDPINKSRGRIRFQVRTNQDKDTSLDSFKQKDISTHLYVVFWFKSCGVLYEDQPNYQLHSNTTLDDAETVDEKYCELCRDAYPSESDTEKKTCIKCKVWYRSNTDHKTTYLCIPCAETLLKYRDKYIQEIEEEDLLKYIL